MALPNVKASPLPVPTNEYDLQYMQALVRTLENYFRQIDGGELVSTDTEARRYSLLVGGE